MIYGLLFVEFLKIGLLSIGGGLATLPFLFNLAETRHWFTEKELLNMMAISEGTPGPFGINVATYAGFQTAGWLGSLVATTALVLPALVIILLIAKFLEKFKENKLLEGFFYGIRPTIAVMIFSFIFQVLLTFFKDLPSMKDVLISSVLFVCYLVLIIRYKRHPIFYIFLGAFMGILLGMS